MWQELQVHSAHLEEYQMVGSVVVLQAPVCWAHACGQVHVAAGSMCVRLAQAVLLHAVAKPVCAVWRIPIACMLSLTGSCQSFLSWLLAKCCCSLHSCHRHVLQSARADASCSICCVYQSMAPLCTGTVCTGPHSMVQKDAVATLSLQWPCKRHHHSFVSPGQSLFTSCSPSRLLCATASLT